jgi:hypothetical protein
MKYIHLRYIPGSKAPYDPNGLNWFTPDGAYLSPYGMFMVFTFTCMVITYFEIRELDRTYDLWPIDPDHFYYHLTLTYTRRLFLQWCVERELMLTEEEWKEHNDATDVTYDKWENLCAVEAAEIFEREAQRPVWLELKAMPVDVSPLIIELFFLFYVVYAFAVIAFIGSLFSDCYKYYRSHSI